MLLIRRYPCKKAGCADYKSKKISKILYQIMESHGAQINVEVQKSDDDDHVKRVRFNISNMDTTFTEKGLDYKELLDIYVVFLTKSDIFKEGKTIYHLGMSIQETGTPVDHGVYR